MNKEGFTLVELLITIGISGLILSSFIFAYGNLQPRSQLNTTVDEVIRSLRYARQKSKTRVNTSSFGVFFDPKNDQYIIYQGSSYQNRNSNYDEVKKLESSVTVSTSFDNNDIHFQSSNGYPVSTGTINIYNKSFDNNSIININKLGLIFKE